MRIAIIPSWYHSPLAPARGSFIKAQAEGLQARGHDVLVLATDRDSDRKLLSLAESNENGVRCIRISVPAPWHRLLGFYVPRVLASIIKREIMKFCPDIVHAHAARPAGTIVFHALKRSCIPYVLTEHSGPLENFWWTFHGKRQIALAYQSASRLFAVSDFLRLAMIAQFGNIALETSVLFNGLDTDLFIPRRSPPMRGSLLFVGSLEKEKGLHILLNSLCSMPDKLPWKLTVVGQGRQERNLRNLAFQLGISEKIVWSGAKMYHDMPNIYASHDFVVVPSLHETFSMVCAEALASARPVIAAMCGGPEEIVPAYGGRLIPANNVKALAECLAEALNGSMHFESERAALHIKEKFSMEVLISKLESVYSSLISSGDS